MPGLDEIYDGEYLTLYRLYILPDIGVFSPELTYFPRNGVCATRTLQKNFWGGRTMI